MDKFSQVGVSTKIKKDLLVLNYLQKNGSTSRIDLCAKLNLTKSAITVITNDMIGSGVLLEKGEQVTCSQTHPRGRRKILLDINKNYKLAFGVVVENQNMIVGLTNLKGQVLDKSKKSIIGKNYRELLELIVLSINTIMKNNCITNENLLALGVCLSKDGGDLIDGVKEIDKISRLKKDLSHALPIKIAINSTIGGSLTAQRIFGRENSKSLLLLRYGDIAESGVMIDGKNYKGFTGNAGGLSNILSNKVDDDRQEEVNLNEKLALSIITCNNIFDTEKVYCFGKHFEDESELQNISEIIDKNGYKKLQLQHAMVTDDTLFLAPCAEAIDCYFYINNNS